VPFVDTLAYAYNKKFINIENITFDGANSYIFSILSSNNISIRNSSLSNSGKYGAYFYQVNDSNFLYNSISNCNNNGIMVGDNSNNVNIISNSFNNIAMLPGMMQLYPSTIAMYAKNSLVQYNSLSYSGYDGILAASGSLQIKNNFINNSMMVLDDGGGIYTAGLKNGLIIDGNIILNTYGYSKGTDDTPSSSMATGIYLDTYSEGIIISNNTVVNSGDMGIFLSRANNNNVTGNTLYDNSIQFEISDLTGLNYSHHNSVTNNSFISKTNDQFCIIYFSNLDNINTFISSSDNNYYVRPINDTKTIWIRQPNQYNSGAGYGYKSLSEWQIFSGKDLNSKKSPVLINNTNNILFEYNPTKSIKTITLNGTYVDSKNISYSGNITLQPFTSIILIKYDSTISNVLCNDLIKNQNETDIDCGGVCEACSTFTRTFYVSSTTGNDANNGTTRTSAWKTISKINNQTFLPGDGILFKRGDTFYGSILVYSSGNSSKPITYSAYSTGEKPLITGFTTVTQWTNLGNNIWESTSTISNSSAINMVTINEINTAMGRYPDSEYLNFESHVGFTSITDNELTNYPNWAGAEMVIRKDHWTLDHNNILSHVNSTLNYNHTAHEILDNFGYFIQKDPKTLTQTGEWYFNATNKKFYIYLASPPQNYVINIANIDRLLNITSRNYITINNVDFKGSNVDSINMTNAANIKILNSNIEFSGLNAISGATVTNLIIENCTINNSNNKGIYLYNYLYYETNALIKSNIIENTGLLTGMGEDYGHGLMGITARGNNMSIEYNNIVDTGYLGIEFLGRDVVVKNNFVKNFCSVMDDGGGIYTFAYNYTGRKIIGNIVLNAIGAPAGTNEPTSQANGIYIDGGATNIEIINNTLSNNSGEGIHFNTVASTLIDGNVFFNNNQQFGMQVLDYGAVLPGQKTIIRNLIVKNNIFFSLNNQYSISYGNDILENITFAQDLASIGNFSNNYYYNQQECAFKTNILSNNNSRRYLPKSFGSWTNEVREINATKINSLPTYKINSIIGSNKLNNSNFTNNITGWLDGYYHTNSNISWASSSPLDNGALKVKYNLIWNYNTIYTRTGEFNSTKKYLLKFDSFSNLSDKTLVVYSNKHYSDYSRLSPNQYFAITNHRNKEEILISPYSNTTNADISFYLGEGNSEFYFDNLELYEANITELNPEDKILFEYNPTRINKIITLNGTYIDVKNITYLGNVTLKPYTSIILIKN
jgi:parallel beta-helix repeat protein